MLRKLVIRNYVLIDSLEIDFPGGLIIVTGQTGAGKSILLGALSLLLGAKADVSMIGAASDNCVVEAEFEADSDNADLLSLLEENDIDWDDGRLVIRRVLNHNGRSRAFLNDSPVSVQVLSSLSSYLIDIHSQHRTSLLADRHFYLTILDYFSGNGSLLKEYSSLYSQYMALKSKSASLQLRIETALRDSEYNRSRYERLERASLREGEIEELEAEQKQLANAEEIKRELCSAESLLSSLSAQGEDYTVSSAIKDAGRHLDRISAYLPALGSLSERLDSCRLEMEDIMAELSRINSETEVSDVRLAEVDERLSLLYSLLQSYSCRNESELIAVRDELSASISDLSSLEEQRNEVEKEKKACFALLSEKAAGLTASRKATAGTFAEAVQSAVRGLEIPEAVFVVDVEQGSLGPEGADSVMFRFSSTGRIPVDIAKCASGGERSRIMLVFKAMMAKYADMPTMIFDEIDTGVSGSVADKMGSLICEMGKDMQVFAITHLPQVAAKGAAHYLVSKENTDGNTVSSIKRLDDNGRVLELARMLSGSVLTEAAIANAKSLLDF